MISRAVTGEQFHLTLAGSDGTRATITELAAGLRALEVRGTAIVETYPETTLPPYGSGIVLVPWPNRVEDGRWEHDGAEMLLDITEPDKHNAIHGLLRNTAYRVVAREESEITLGASVFPQHGYPFHLDTRVTYRLVADGIVVTHEIVNFSDAAAPVAVGAHPYLRVGDAPVADVMLELAASTHFEVTDRLNAREQHDVTGTRFDVRAPHRIGDLELDDGFGGVAPGSVHRLTAPDGRTVEQWSDDEFGYVQVFANRKFPNSDGIALAVEPMTAPANALNTGLGLHHLEPGATWTVSWGLRYTDDRTRIASDGT